jgi:hypothetical protein
MELSMQAGAPPTGPVNPYAAPETPADAGVVGTAAHDLTPDEVRAFVGEKHAYYWGNWRPRPSGRGIRAGFNWAAFFLNVFWLLYRRMYREFFILVAALLGVGILHGMVASLMEKNLDGVEKVVNIVVAVTMGMRGNGLYLRRARRVIGIARAQEPDPERRLVLLKARGGTSWIGLLVALAVGIGAGFLAAMAR